ncbi:MAG: hypothetical protein JWM89_3849 [Acidimicrobiales bacterium]|nr:hypothetical protein [Acidimicrobiales bacterium]
MRSRYTAYVLHDEGHLLRTWAPERRPHAVTFDPDRRWIGLEIVSASDSGLLASTGSVEFVARSTIGEDDEALHERSRFRRDERRWLYVDGDVLP